MQKLNFLDTKCPQIDDPSIFKGMTLVCFHDMLFSYIIDGYCAFHNLLFSYIIYGLYLRAIYWFILQDDSLDVETRLKAFEEEVFKAPFTSFGWLVI